MHLKSTEAAGASTPPNPPEDPQPLDEQHHDDSDQDDHSDSEEAGQSSGQSSEPSSGPSSGPSLDEAAGHSMEDAAGHSSQGQSSGHSSGGHSSGVSDEGGQSSEQDVFIEGNAMRHSGEGSASAGIQWPETPADIMRQRAPERMLCHIHQQQIGLRNRMMNTVACQTDNTKDFSPIVFDPLPSDDPSSSEGVLRLMIQNFRNMSDTVRGPTKRIQNVSWRIMVMPRQHVVQKKGTQKCLGFFLQCCPEAYSDTWSCQSAAELRLISQKAGVPHFTRKTNHIYTAKENDWGYSCFMTWADILDDSQGYIKDDRVVLEVTVKADPPKNIVGIDEFRKTIQNWIDLADLQFRRGKIDLAIEANGQGLKFCKDKDVDCRRKLEEQKRNFIEKKLEESIQRIETAQKKEHTDEPDTVSNQTALRMALTSNNHKNKNNKNKKFQKNVRPRAPTPNSQPKVTTNTAVKTENAKTVQQTQTAKKDAPTSDGKKIDAVDKKNAADQEDETKSTGESSSEKILIKGRFNPKIFNGSVPVSWARRSKMEEELLSEAACCIATETDMTAHERDSFVMKYMTDQMRALNYPEVKDGKKKLFYNMQQLRSFAESAFEVEMQRQTIIKKAANEANEFMVRVFGDQPKEDGADFELMEWDMSLLWNDNKADQRAMIIDREASFLDAKIRLFWDALGGMEKFLESDSSDRDSVSSAESDRQNDGCLKPKRTRLDTVCECCLKEQSQTYPTTCDSEVQTEDVVKALNSSRCQPDAHTGVVKKTKAATQATPQKQPPQSPIVTTKMQPPKVLNTTPPSVKATPTKSTSASTETTPPPTSSEKPAVIPSFNFGDFGGPDSNQVINALSTVAMNMMNTRRIINKAEEFMILIAKNSNEINFRTALRDISKVAGIAYVENEEKFRPTSPLLSDEFGEEDFATLYAKLMSEEHRELMVMNQQVEKFDNYKKQLHHYMFLDQDDVDRLIKGSRAVNTKIADFEKKVKDLHKQNEDLESKHKKVEKQLREEAKSSRSAANQEKEKNNQLNKEVKDKNRALKNAETRAITLQSERNDLAEKQKQTQKELTTLQKRSSEDAAKYKREIQQLQDQKKALQAELSSRDHDHKVHNNHMDEKNREVKKLREEVACEKNKVNQLHQVAITHQERAKKSEIALLQHQLDAGLSLLDRAMVDANKKMKEMEDAASNRARSANEVSLCIQSRDEWCNIIDEIRKSIDSTKIEHEAQIDAIRNGKPLSSLPKIAVPKPPPAPQIVKIAPIAPVEPTKPLPGVIGSRPQPSGITTLTTAASSSSTTANATATTPRPASPGSRAPGSPINKPSSSSTTSTSPARHAPIGTRPNGTVVNGCSSESSSTLTTTNNPWSSWSDSVSSLTDHLHPQKRFGSEERSSLFSTDLLGLSTGLGSSSAWSNDDTWSNTVSNLAQTLNSSSNSASFMNPMNLHPSQLQQQVQQHQQVQHPTVQQQVQQQQAPGPQHPQQQQAQSHQHPQSQQNHQQYTQTSTWGNYPEMHRQYMFRQQQQYQQHLTIIAKKIGMDLEKTNEIVTDFCREHKLHYQNISGDDSVVDKIREHYNKRNLAFRMSAPPGAAPGYMANPLVSVMERPNYNLMGDNHQMNDRSGGMSQMDKWMN